MELDGNKLRRARERLGYSLEVVGEEAGLSKNSVLRAEHEEDIRPGTARKIAEALGVEVAELIADPKAPAPSPEILEGEDWERRRATITGLTIVATELRKRWAEELQQGGLAEHRAMEIVFAIKGVLENAESQTILGGLDHTDKADVKPVMRLRKELQRLVELHNLAVEQSITGFKFESIIDGVVLEQVSASPVETAKESHA